jgi:outer membrane protein insertion porin family
VREAMRALYATGFFRDVELRRDGGTLVIAVLERPSIESFEITGNKDIKTEDLRSRCATSASRRQDLQPLGARRGQAAPDRPVLQPRQVRREGRHQGRGSARQPRQDRRSTSSKASAPGSARSTSSATTAFSDEDLLEEFKLRRRTGCPGTSQDDRYSREELQGDLEKLRSYYMDRGYANIDVESTQVAIAPEKDDIFITLNVREGEVYRSPTSSSPARWSCPRSSCARYLAVQAAARPSRASRSRDDRS